MMIATILTLIFAQSAELVRPEALLEFQRARSQLRTGRISCLVTGGPRLATSPQVHYTMQMASDGAILYSFDGDSEGVFDRDMYGYPIMVGRGVTLVQPDVAWHKSTFDYSGIVAPNAAWKSRGAPFYWGVDVDLRTIGMAPDWDTLVKQDVGSVLSNAAKGATGYSVRREGSIHHVTVHFPDQRSMVYEIDEAKGWNATRISGSKPGAVWECTIDVRKTGEVWFPQTVRLTVNGEPRAEWVVTDVRLNSHDDARGWDPADVGFEIGMPVVVLGLEEASGPRGLLWDGEKAAPYDEVAKRMRSGELEPGPTLKLMREHKYRPPGSELLAQLRSSPRVLETFISGWEFYVATFCTRHRLDDDQVKQAYKCLRRAQEAANQYLSHSREKLEALQKKRDRGELTADQAEAEFTRLRQPVDEIFEKQLKPGLEKIPTAEQKQAAAQRQKEEEQRGFRLRLEEPQHRRPAESQPQRKP